MTQRFISVSTNQASQFDGLDDTNSSTGAFHKPKDRDGVIINEKEGAQDIYVVDTEDAGFSHFKEGILQADFSSLNDKTIQADIFNLQTFITNPDNLVLTMPADAATTQALQQIFGNKAQVVGTYPDTGLNKVKIGPLMAEDLPALQTFSFMAAQYPQLFSTADDLNLTMIAQELNEKVTRAGMEALSSGTTSGEVAGATTGGAASSDSLHSFTDYSTVGFNFFPLLIDDISGLVRDDLEFAIDGEGLFTGAPQGTHFPNTPAEMQLVENYISQHPNAEIVTHPLPGGQAGENVRGVATKVSVGAEVAGPWYDRGWDWTVDHVFTVVPTFVGASFVFGYVVWKIHNRLSNQPKAIQDEALKQAELARLKEEFQRLGKETFMSKYADDLIEVAAQLHEKSKTSGEKIQLLGRSVEIKEAFSVWLMKTKSMSVFLAPAGAGKTVSAIEMALHIYFRRLIMQREVELRAKKELGPNERLTKAMFEAKDPKTVGLEWSLCPEVLAREEYWNFGMTKMVSGTNLRGDLEGRVTFILDLLRKFQNMRLHIDELADLTEDHGQNESSEARVMKALKPGLADGTVKGTASAVFKRWRAIASKSDEMGRRFRPIMLRLLPDDVVDNIGGRSISNQLIYWKDRGRWVPPSDDAVGRSILGKKSAKPSTGADKISRRVLPPMDKVPPSVLVQGVTLVADDGIGNLVPLLNADGEYVIPGINKVLREKSAKNPGANPDRTKSLGEDVTSLILYDLSQGDIDPARVTVNADGSCTIRIDAPFIENLIGTRITDPVVQGVLYRLDETVSDLSRFSVSAEQLGVDLTVFEPLLGESPDEHTTRILNLQAELERVAKLYADLEAGTPTPPYRVKRAVDEVKILFTQKGVVTVTGPGTGTGGSGVPSASANYSFGDDTNPAQEIIRDGSGNIYYLTPEELEPVADALADADSIPFEEQPAANNTLHFEDENKLSTPQPSFWKGFGMEAGSAAGVGVAMEGFWMGVEEATDLHIPSIVRTPLDLGAMGIMAVATAAKGAASSTASEFAETLLPGMARFLPGAIVGGGLTSWGLNKMGYETDSAVNRLGSVFGAGVVGAGSNKLLTAVCEEISSIPLAGPAVSEAVGGVVAPVMGAVMAYPMVGEAMDFVADEVGATRDYTGRTTIQVTTSGALGYLGSKALGVVAEKVGVTSAIEVAKQAGQQVVIRGATAVLNTASQAATYVTETAIPAVTSYVSAQVSATGAAIVEGGAAGASALTGVVLAAGGLVASTWEVNTMSTSDYQAQRKEGGVMAGILDSDMSWMEYLNYQNLPKIWGGEKVTTNPLDRNTWK